MTLTVMPWVMEQFLDDNGRPLASGRIFTYAAGTSTKLATYQESSASTAHSNPIVLDSAGRPPAPIFLQARSYKFVAAAAGIDDPPTSPEWTADNISQVSPFDVDLDITGTSGEAIAVNEWVYLSQGDGGLTAGAWYLTDADLDYKSTTARKVGVAVSLASAAAQDITIRLGGRATSFAGLTPGALYYLSSAAGAITSTAPSSPRRVAQADSTTSVVLETDYEEPLLGYIEIPLASWREIVAAEIPNAAANGGLLASDTTPAFIRINTGTDKGCRMVWVAGNSDEVSATFTYPPDLDDGQPLIFNMRAAMSGTTNSPTVQVDYFEGIGDTNAGGVTAAVTGTALATYTRTIAAADVGAYPTFATICLAPGVHAADAVRVYATWVTYTRKLKS